MVTSRRFQRFWDHTQPPSTPRGLGIHLASPQQVLGPRQTPSPRPHCRREEAPGNIVQVPPAQSASPTTTVQTGCYHHDARKFFNRRFKKLKRPSLALVSPPRRDGAAAAAADGAVPLAPQQPHHSSKRRVAIWAISSPKMSKAGAMGTLLAIKLILGDFSDLVIMLAIWEKPRESCKSPLITIFSNSKYI